MMKLDAINNLNMGHVKRDCPAVGVLEIWFRT